MRQVCPVRIFVSIPGQRLFILGQHGRGACFYAPSDSVDCDRHSGVNYSHLDMLFLWRQIFTQPKSIPCLFAADQKSVVHVVNEARERNMLRLVREGAYC